MPGPPSPSSTCAPCSHPLQLPPSSTAQPKCLSFLWVPFTSRACAEGVGSGAARDPKTEGGGGTPRRLWGCLHRLFNCQRDLLRTWISHSCPGCSPSACHEVLAASSARQGPLRSDLRRPSAHHSQPWPQLHSPGCQTAGSPHTLPGPASGQEEPLRVPSPRPVLPSPWTSPAHARRHCELRLRCRLFGRCSCADRPPGI